MCRWDRLPARRTTRCRSSSPAGDVYVFCTDGVFEATDARGREFGIERLTKIVLESRKLPAKAIVESVFSAVTDFRGEVPAKDDMTVVALLR